METDFINTILSFLDRKTRESRLSDDHQYHLRYSILGLFANLFDKTTYNEEFILRNLELIFSDGNYLIANIIGVLKCLSKVSKFDRIWP